MSFNTITIQDASYGNQSLEVSPPTRPPTYKDASYVLLTAYFETVGYPGITMTTKNANQNSSTSEYIVTYLNQDSYYTSEIVINGQPYSGELIMNPAESYSGTASCNAITGETLLLASGTQSQGSGFTHSEYTFNILEYNSSGVAYKGGWGNQKFDVSVNIYNLTETSNSSGTSITLNYNIDILWCSSTSSDASFVPVSSLSGFEYIIVTSDSGNTTWTFTSNTEEYTYLTYYPSTNSINYTLSNNQLLIFGWIGSLGGMVNYNSYTLANSPIPLSSLIMTYVNLINTLENSPYMLSTLLSVNSDYNNNTYNTWQSNIDVSFNNYKYNNFENYSANFFNYTTSTTGVQDISSNYIYSESSYDYTTSNGNIISYYLVYDTSYGAIYYQNGKEINNTAAYMTYSFIANTSNSGSFLGYNSSNGVIIPTIYGATYLDISYNSLYSNTGTTVYYYTKGLSITYVNGTYTEQQNILSVSVKQTTGYDSSYATATDPSGMYYQYSFSGTYATNSSSNQTIPLNAIRYNGNGTYSWQNDSSTSTSYSYLNLYLYFLGITSIVSAVEYDSTELGAVGAVLNAPYLYSLYGVSPTLNKS